MSYIGSTPTTQSFIAGTDYFNGTGSQVAFTLSRSVNSVNDIEVIVNNVEQIPSGYSVSGTTLTFSAAPSAGTSNVYVRYLSTTNLSLAIPAGTSASFNTVTATTLAATNFSYTGTLTGNGGIINIGSGQVYKDASGNVGIGVIPSAWTSIDRAFEIGRAGNGMFSGGIDDLSVNSNAYYTSGWKYGSTGFANRINVGAGTGAFQFFTAPSGTAGNAITFTQAMTLDASGNLQLTSGGTWATSAGGLQLSMNNNDGYITTYYDTHTVTLGAGVSAKNQIKVSGAGGANNITFSVAGSERARIDSSGNLLVGTTSYAYANSNNQILGGGQAIIQHVSGTASGASYCDFTLNAGRIGNIAQNGTTAISYNTSSDYRLKEAIAPMTGALAKVALLKPCTYKWKVDGSDGQGFIAHELAEVEAGCVTGEKDAVDAEGNPQYQGIDTSFLVATLAAAIQELKAIVDAQGAEIAALKGTP